jgi:hypothetical protein
MSAAARTAAAPRTATAFWWSASRARHRPRAVFGSTSPAPLARSFGADRRKPLGAPRQLRGQAQRVVSALRQRQAHRPISNSFCSPGRIRLRATGTGVRNAGAKTCAISSGTGLPQRSFCATKKSAHHQASSSAPGDTAMTWLAIAAAANGAGRPEPDRSHRLAPGRSAKPSSQRRPSRPTTSANLAAVDRRRPQAASCRHAAKRLPAGPGSLPAGRRYQASRSAASSSERPARRTAAAAHFRASRWRQAPAQAGSERTKKSSEFSAAPAQKAASVSRSDRSTRQRPGRHARRRRGDRG